MLLGPGFLAVIPATHRKTEKEGQLADGRGEEGRGERLVLYNTLNTL
jgi:hypothetical protein